LLHNLRQLQLHFLQLQNFRHRLKVGGWCFEKPLERGSSALVLVAGLV
jgi:hypothetical protein